MTRKRKKTEFFCEPCKEEGKSLKAKGYCLDCSECLCETCFDSHCIPRPFRRHRLCCTGEIPDSVKENITDKQNDIEPLVCQIHDGSVIIHYCGTHKQFCCEKCLQIGHVVCNDLKNITEFTNEISSRNEFNSFCASMTRFRNKWQIEKQRALSSLDDVNRCYETTISFVTNQLGEMKAADSAYLGSVISACESTITQIDQWLLDVESFKTTKQNKKLVQFMQSKSTQSQLGIMDDYIHASFGKSQITRYCIRKVIPSETIINIAKTPFLLKILNACTCNTGHKISDIICLDKNVVVVEQKHQMICMIDTTEDKVISSQKTNGVPVQMSSGEHKDASILYNNTSGSIKSIHLYEQDNKLNLKDGDTIPTESKTIDYYNQMLKVIGKYPLQLVELTLDGKVDRIVSKDLSQTKDANGRSLISSVSFSTVDKSTGSVFVPGNNSIVEIKDDGTVELFAYSELLKSPQNIRVLEDSSLLVASSENKNVYRVYRSGHVSSVFPKPLDFPVVAIDYATEERLLFVSGESRSVHVYQL